jgi:predicted dehydrogenase
MNKIRLGIIGGGIGSFIGAVHLKAALLDGHYELVCGAFSSNPDVCRQTADGLGLDAARSYVDWQNMLAQEAARPAGQRMQVVAIVTPNHLHAVQTIAALELGIHVILDKPMAVSLQQAHAIDEAARKSQCLLALTHTYAGYPLVKEARAWVREGRLGVVRKVLVEYPQGWLATALEDQGHKQALWRTDPALAGAGAIADIGTHAAHLAEYVSGLKIEAVCADLKSVVAGRLVDDDAAALLRFENGASGVLVATQVATGEENNVRIRVYGDLGGLDWCHADSSSLRWVSNGQPMQIFRAGESYLSPAARNNSRLPAGHPEGFIEAFGNIYRAFAMTLGSDGTPASALADAGYDFPGIAEGLRGLAFVEAMQASASSSEKWTQVKI